MSGTRLGDSKAVDVTIMKKLLVRISQLLIQQCVRARDFLP